jgi:hypothetical protein
MTTHYYFLLFFYWFRIYIKESISLIGPESTYQVCIQLPYNLVFCYFFKEVQVHNI